MTKRAVHVVGLVAVLAVAGSAFAQPTFEYEYSDYGLDFPPPDISRYIQFSDLIADYTIGYNGFFEGGDVDPANNVECYNFSPFGCLEQYDGVENAYVWPVDCFWHGLGGNCGPDVQMPFLTDGDGSFSVPFRDFARASNVLRYDFDEPTDIGEIVVWTEYEDPTFASPRLFQTYDVYVSYDDSTTGMTLLAQDVRNGEWGASIMPASYQGSYTALYDCASSTLATGVTKIRFVFYPVTYDGSDLMADAWRGYWHPGNSAAWNACETDPNGPQIPADPRDLDGRQKTFVASWVNEIDVLPPQAMNDPGDGDGDSDVDLVDLEAFGYAVTGPDLGPIAYAERPFDFASKDCDVDLADFASMQVLVTP